MRVKATDPSHGFCCIFPQIKTTVLGVMEVQWNTALQLPETPVVFTMALGPRGSALGIAATKPSIKACHPEATMFETTMYSARWCQKRWAKLANIISPITRVYRSDIVIYLIYSYWDYKSIYNWRGHHVFNVFWTPQIDGSTYPIRRSDTVGTQLKDSSVDILTIWDTYLIYMCL